MVMVLDFYDRIANLFGVERATSCMAEIQYLMDKGYDEEHILTLLKDYALPVGVFYILSVLVRSKLSVDDLRSSLSFLFDGHKIIVEKVAGLLKPYSRILDFGCGQGLLSCSLAMRGFEVYGVDISPEAIQIANKLAENLKCKVYFQSIDGGTIPFPDGYFDAIFCVWTLHEIPQNQMLEILREFHRVLREEGYLFIIDQEYVAPFELIKASMNKVGFEICSEVGVSPVYDHGKMSKAILIEYVKRKQVPK
jgi:2-polyprenyl-3-methyl-5-hydroxy-6-metoxy-1,4-benzoquinol methylase